MGRLKCPPFSKRTHKALPDGTRQHSKDLREVRMSWFSETLGESEPWRNEFQTLITSYHGSWRVALPWAQRREHLWSLCLIGAVGPGMVEATSCWTCTHSPCALRQCITLAPKHMNEAAGSTTLQKLEGLGAMRLRKSQAAVLIHILNP